MSWQQTLVIAWTQFAAGTLIMLCLTRFTLKWVSQPVERTRLISGMFAATLQLPVILVFSPFPSLTLPLISLRATDSRLAQVMAARAISSAETALQIHDAGNNNKTDKGTSQPIPPIDRTAAAHPDGANPIAAAAASETSRWSVPDAWFLSACAILAIHILAGAYFAIETAIGHSRLRRLSFGATNASEAVSSAWASVAGDRGTNVRLLVSSEIVAPLMFGWVRPTIVIPRALAEKVDSELNACLAHEWSHIQSGDVLTWSFVNICQIVLWYQPLFWPLRRELRVNQEFLADYRSTRTAMTSLEYSELLFRLARDYRSISATPALTMFDRPSELALRIKMLLEAPLSMNVRCRPLFTCIMLAAAALLPIGLSAVRVDSIHAEDGIATVVELDAIPDATVIVAEKPPEPDTAAAPEKNDEPKSESPRWRTVTYTSEITLRDQPKLTKTKVYLAEDGRRRDEIEDHTVSIMDMFSSIRLTLMKRLHTAIVNKPSAMAENIDQKQRALLAGSAQRYLQNIRDLCTSDSTQLGQKEVDGKLADGFVATNTGNTYTIWIDRKTGELVRVEYDTTSLGTQMHIAMSYFRFGEKLDESLFSFEVPRDYKVLPRASVASASDSAEQKAIDAPGGMKKMWSSNRKMCKLAALPGPRGLWTVDFSGTFELLDERGTKLAIGPRTVPKPIGDQFGPAKLVRVASLDGNGNFKLLNVDMLGKTVKAYDTDGKMQWAYSQGDSPGHPWSVNDICAVDLNGDARDEVVIGFNGSTGLHVLDHEGKPLWKETSIANVWHVTAGNIEGDARPEVVCTSASGKVHVFNGEGHFQRALDAGIYATMIRTWQPLDKSPDRIIVAGTVNKVEKMAAIDSNANDFWSLELKHRVVSAATCQQKPWLAFTLADGTAHIIDVTQGNEIARVGGQGDMTDAAWMPVQQGDPLLVISNQIETVAYRIEKEMP